MFYQIECKAFFDLPFSISKGLTKITYRSLTRSFSTMAKTFSPLPGLINARPVNLLKAGRTQYCSVK